MRRSFCLQYEYGHIEWIFICYGKTYDDRVCVTILIRRHFCPFSLPVSVLCFRFFLFLFVVCWIQFDSLVLCPWHMHKTPSKCCSLKKSLAHYCFFFSSARCVLFSSNGFFFLAFGIRSIVDDRWSFHMHSNFLKQTTAVVAEMCCLYACVWTKIPLIDFFFGFFCTAFPNTVYLMRCIVLSQCWH